MAHNVLGLYGMNVLGGIHVYVIYVPVSAQKEKQCLITVCTECPFFRKGVLGWVFVMSRNHYLFSNHIHCDTQCQYFDSMQQSSSGQNQLPALPVLVKQSDHDAWFVSTLRWARSMLRLWVCGCDLTRQCSTSVQLIVGTIKCADIPCNTIIQGQHAYPVMCILIRHVKYALQASRDSKEV